MAGTNSFKVYMCEEVDSTKSEVRRFAVNWDIDFNFVYLREKLLNIFPTIRGKRFTIYWKGMFINIFLI